MSDFVIKGGYGLRNFGDDALMYYLVKSIENKHPGVNIALDCNKANYITKWLPNVTFSKPYQVPQKAYIYGGGTLYYSFPKKLESKPFIEKVVLGVTHPSLVLNKLLAKSRRKNFEKSKVKKVMFGLGFGPFHVKNELYEQAILDAKGTDIVCVRDSKSYEFVTQHNANAFHGTDICFAKGIASKNTNNNSTEVKKIGVIIRDWNYGTEEDNYKDNLQEAITQIRKIGYKAQYIVFSDLRDNDWLNTLQEQQEDILIWNPDNDSIEYFMEKLSHFDLFISSRFHGVIFSTLLNIPAISVAIEPKLELVKENAICKVWHPMRDGVDDLLSMVNDFNDNYLTFVTECQRLVNEKSKLYNEMLDFAFKDSE
ncbi:polysaccharide pyruvyl transferase family protein [Thalassotalea ganghwensis]